MKRSITKLLLSASLILGGVQNALAEVYSGTFSGSEATWELNTETGVLTFSGEGVARLVIPNGPWATYKESVREIVVGSDVTIPSTLDLTRSCPNLTAVTINSNEVMASEASLGTIFGPQVTKYTIGEGVKKIRANFYACTQMQELHLPVSLDSICCRFTSGCINLKSIHITNLDRFLRIGYGKLGGNPVTATEEQLYPREGGIGDGRHLYLNGTEVTKITVPEGITSIAPYQFAGWPALESVILPASVKEIGQGAFEYAMNLTHVSIPEGVTAIEPYTFHWTGAWAGGWADTLSVSLPSTLRSIGEGAFFGTRVSSIVIPEGVDSIANQAFSGTTLTSISLPSTLRYVGEYAFANCEKLKRADFASIQSLCNIEFMDAAANPICYARTLSVQGTEVRNVVIPEGLERIRPYTFQKADINSAQLPSSLKEIGAYAFAYAGLKNLTLPNGLEKIDDFAFLQSALQTINIPQSVQSIGLRAFYGSELTAMDLTGYKGSIGFLAFNDCQRLDRVTLPAKDPRYYTSADGKLIFQRDSTRCWVEPGDGEWAYKDTLICEPVLISVLPTAEELVIPYPVTGRINQYDDFYVDEGELPRKLEDYKTTALQGTFKSLRRLELPCTWDVAVGVDNSMEAYMPKLEELILRSAKPTLFGDAIYWKQNSAGENPRPIYDEDGNIINFNTKNPDIYVFDHAKADYEKAAKNFRFDWDGKSTYGHALYQAEFKTLSLPGEQMYLKESLPAFSTEQSVVRQKSETEYYVWNADWENALQNDLPEYFTSDAVTKGAYVPTDYRFSILKRYLTEEKQYAMPDSLVKCIDGNIHVSHNFDTNDYLKWYLTPDTVTANYATIEKGSIASVVANPAWDIPNGTYYYVTPTGTSQPTLTFDVRMLPGIKYNVSLLVAPHHSKDGVECSDSLKNKVKPSMISANGTNYKTVNGTNIEIAYTGFLGQAFLFEEVEVTKDHINRIQIKDVTSTLDRRNKGFTSEMSVLGVLVEPLNAPDGIAETAAPTPRQAAIYDLQGRRVASPAKGIYILGGKKVLVK